MRPDDGAVEGSGERADATLDRLFARYVEERVVQETEPVVEELCRGRPELVVALRQRVEKFHLVDEHLSQARRLPPGTVLGPYQVGSELGRGSMGIVYAAYDPVKKRQVALKVLRPERGQRRELLARFAREAKILRRLRHPNIVTCYGLETLEGLTLLVFELVEGVSLAQDLPATGLDVADCLKIARDLAAALAAAHELRVVHRDLKLANLMRTPDGTLKVLDFGLAYLPRESGGSSITHTGQTVGSVPYMAPEQLLGQRASPASDVFAFGVVMYELLTGRRPFRGKNLSGTVQAIFESEPPPLASCSPATPGLVILVDQCIRKSPENRPRDGASLQRQLTDLVPAKTLQKTVRP